MKLRLLALLLAVPVTSAGAAGGVNTGANYRTGSYACGVVCEGASPVYVEKETVTLNIAEFPKESYVSSEDFLGYAASAETSYTLCNPTGEDVSLPLSLPLGAAPSYGQIADEAGVCPEYSVMSGGTPISSDIRYSYPTVETESPVASYIAEEERFYRSDVPVTEYLYEFGLPSSDTPRQLCLYFDGDPSVTRVLLSQYAYVRIDDGRSMAKINLIGEEHRAEIGFFVLGGRLKSEPEWKIYKNWNQSEEETAEFSSRVVGQTTLGELMLRVRPQGSSVSDADWLAASFGYLEASTDESMCLLEGKLGGFSEKDLVRRAEYSVVVPAHGKIEHSVSVPIYPDVSKGNTVRCEYKYLLSPARKWSDFGRLEIRINTEFSLADSSLRFEKTEGGYEFARDGLPQGELVFALTDTGSEGVASEVQPPEPTWMFYVFPIAGVALVAGVLIFLLSRKRRS